MANLCRPYAFLAKPGFAVESIALALEIDWIEKIAQYEKRGCTLAGPDAAAWSNGTVEELMTTRMMRLSAIVTLVVAVVLVRGVCPASADDFRRIVVFR